MGVTPQRAAGAALVCLGIGAGVPAAGPATAMSHPSSKVGNSADTHGFPDGEFWIQSAYQVGPYATCMSRGTLGERRVGELRRDSCESKADRIWSYDPQTRQIRLAADPAICLWGVPITTAPCDPTQLTAKDGPKAVLQLFAGKGPWARAWYHGTKLRLYIRRQGDANKPLFLVTSAGTSEEHRPYAHMTAPEKFDQWQPETLVWNLVPPTAANG